MTTQEFNALRSFSRRQFVKTAGLATGALALGVPNLFAGRRDKSLPKPQNSGIEHIVVVCMENRSFDHFVGWTPGADGKQAGLLYTGPAGTFPTYPLAPDYQGCGHPDPDHSYAGGRVEYDGGLCDGWLQAGSNDEYAIGYYTQADLPFMAGAVENWTSCDRYFAPIMAGTYPNRFYLHAAQTDRLENTLDLSTLPTIWDRLVDHGLSAKYYFSDVPFLALWGPRYIPIMNPIAEFFADCAEGKLPKVSYVDPRLLGEEEGLSNDDHPHADVRNGEAFLNDVYNAIRTSPNWAQTLLVITFDEWGGFFDHVPPQTAPIPPATAAAGDADGLRGFRVPTIIISPWSGAAEVSHLVLDHTSILRMIEWRWHLEPLTIRDATANNLASVLDFSQRRLNPPGFAVPPGFFGAPCIIEQSAPSEWEELAVIAHALGII